MKCDPKDLLLYAVTDRHWLNGRTLVDVVKESLDGGVTMIQLREKSLDEGKFLEEAKELQALCRERHVPFIVNDNVDIAKAMDADGVHVGQDDMAALDARAKLGPDKLIGVSAHTVEEALLAEKQGAVVRHRGDRQHAACAQPLHRRRYIGFCQTAVAADVAGRAAVWIVVQKQQDVNFQLVQPVLYGSSLKPRCMVLFVVLYVAQYGQQLHHSFARLK